MIRLVLAIVIGLPSVANAQEIKYFNTMQECGPADVMFNEALAYDETPLFSGFNSTYGVDGTAYYGQMLFTVNQDSGTWSLFSVYDDGTVCLVNFGAEFEPVAN